MRRPVRGSLFFVPKGGFDIVSNLPIWGDIGEFQGIIPLWEIFSIIPPWFMEKISRRGFFMEKNRYGWVLIVSHSGGLINFL